MGPGPQIHNEKPLALIAPGAVLFFELLGFSLNCASSITPGGHIGHKPTALGIVCVFSDSAIRHDHTINATDVGNISCYMSFTSKHCHLRFLPNLNLR